MIPSNISQAGGGGCTPQPCRTNRWTWPWCRPLQRQPQPRWRGRVVGIIHAQHLHGRTFQANHASSPGGAIIASGAPTARGTCAINVCTFEQNRSDIEAGALSINNFSDTTM